LNVNRYLLMIGISDCKHKELVTYFK